MSKKAENSGLTKKLLTWDVDTTTKIVKYVDCHYEPLIKLENILKGLEISCHGVVWVIGTATMMFMFNLSIIRRLSVNLFLALLIDIAIVAIIKASVRRKKPIEKRRDSRTSSATEEYSFPSGHASRATMLAFLLLHEFSFAFPFRMFLLAWSSGVCASKLLMKRHYLFDIIGGLAIGWLNAYFVSRVIWLSDNSADAVVDFFLDESRVGASYDV